jgi:hypothetical protein
LKSIVASESQQPSSSGIISFVSVKVDAITVEWIFGMGFDDHEESYVTLNNRNFSKLILDQLGSTEKQIEGIIITPNDFNAPK